MKNVSVRKSEGAVGGTGGLDRGIGRHTVDQLAVLLTLRGNQQSVVHANPEPLELLGTGGLDLYQDAR